MRLKIKVRIDAWKYYTTRTKHYGFLEGLQEGSLSEACFCRDIDGHFTFNTYNNRLFLALLPQCQLLPITMVIQDKDNANYKANRTIIPDSNYNRLLR